MSGKLDSTANYFKKPQTFWLFGDVYIHAKHTVVHKCRETQAHARKQECWPMCLKSISKNSNEARCVPCMMLCQKRNSHKQNYSRRERESLICVCLYRRNACVAKCVAMLIALKHKRIDINHCQTSFKIVPVMCWRNSPMPQTSGLIANGCASECR